MGLDSITIYHILTGGCTALGLLNTPHLDSPWFGVVGLMVTPSPHPPPRKSYIPILIPTTCKPFLIWKRVAANVTELRIWDEIILGYPGGS